MTPDGWRQCTLADIAADEFGMVDGPFGSNLPASCYTLAGVPVIRGSNLSLGQERFNAQEFVFVSEATAMRLERSLSRPGDIIFTKKGTLGQTGIVPDNIGYSKFLVSSNQMKLAVSRKVADPLFVYYYISSPESRDRVVRESTASGVPKINLAYLRKFPITLPPLNEQRAIASTLGALDDKIELNRRMNQTLEETARTIFKSWFVDFDPVVAKSEGRQPYGMNAETVALFPSAFQDSELGPIPQGWRVGKTSDICATQYGYTASASSMAIGPRFLRITDMNKEPWVDWGSVPYCAIDGKNLAKYKLQIGDVLVSRMADPGKAAIVEESLDAVFASYLVRLNTKTLAWSYFLFYFLRSDQYLDYANGAMGGSVQAGMNARVIVGADMVLPSNDVVGAFLRAVYTLRTKITNNLQQSRTLVAIRDALLPKLLSGEMRVKDAADFQRIIG